MSVVFLASLLIGLGEWELSVSGIGEKEGKLLIPIFAKAELRWSSLQFQVDLCGCEGNITVDSVTLLGHGRIKTFWEREVETRKVSFAYYITDYGIGKGGGTKSVAVGIESSSGSIRPLAREVVCLIWASVNPGCEGLFIRIDSVLSCEPWEEISCGFVDEEGVFHPAILRDSVFVRR